VTALMLASQLGLVKVAMLLLRKLKQTEVQVQDDYGRTALHHALLHKTDVMMKLIDDGGYDMTVRDAKGRRELHDALIRAKVDFAAHLLYNVLPPEPEDNDGESLLIAACRSGFKEAVSLLVERWPGIINGTDSDYYGQTPLSVACEYKQRDIVDILLREKNLLRPNQPVRGWQSWTPLHIAVFKEAPDCITSLLYSMDVSLDTKDDKGQTPLGLALRLTSKASTKAILMHPRISDAVRIEQLTSFCARPASAFHDIFPDVLAVIDPKSLTTNDVVGFVEASTRLANPAMLEASLKKSIECGAWKQTKTPCLLAARMGKFDMVEELVVAGADPTEVDEDNWSCADYAARFDHGQSAVDRMAKLISEHPTPGARPDYAVPTIFEIPEGLEENIAVGLCDDTDHVGHKALRSFHVTKPHSALEQACLRTRSCIPPTRNYFYFEVTIQEDSESRFIGLGYCGEDMPGDSISGPLPGSQADPADNGNRLVETGQDGDVPGRYVRDYEAYRIHYVVGAGLNLETGEGFCTLNGERRDVGEIAPPESRTPPSGVLEPSQLTLNQGRHFRTRSLLLARSIHAWPWILQVMAWGYDSQSTLGMTNATRFAIAGRSHSVLAFAQGLCHNISSNPDGTCISRELLNRQQTHKTFYYCVEATFVLTSFQTSIVLPARLVILVATLRRLQSSAFTSHLTP
jgi:ankyrin repeat protein